MSWFFGSSSSPKSNIPPTTALQQQRLKQIESLRTFHKKLDQKEEGAIYEEVIITEVQRDVEYRVTFNVGSSTVFLNITLPPQFPIEKPIVKVAPPIRHPWVNDQMVIVGCPALVNFYMHSNLGKAIQDVAREFCDHPPQFLGSQVTPPQSNASVSGYQPPSLFSFPGYQPMYTPRSSIPSVSPGLDRSMLFAPPVTCNMSVVPPLPGIAKVTNANTSISGPPKKTSLFPELEQLSLEELKDIADKTDAMDLFLSKLDVIKKIEADKEELLKKNEDIARYNLSLEPQLESSKDDLIKKCQRLSELQIEFANNSQKQMDLMEAISLSAIHSHLQVAAAEAEERSEAIADEFLTSKMTPEEFIKRFLEKRKLSHCRKAKEEKIRNLRTSY